MPNSVGCGLVSIGPEDSQSTRLVATQARSNKPYFNSARIKKSNARSKQCQLSALVVGTLQLERSGLPQDVTINIIRIIFFILLAAAALRVIS